MPATWELHFAGEPPQRNSSPQGTPILLYQIDAVSCDELRRRLVGGVVAFGMGAVYDTHGGQCMEAAYAQCHNVTVRCVCVCRLRTAAELFVR